MAGTEFRRADELLKEKEANQPLVIEKEARVCISRKKQTA